MSLTEHEYLLLGRNLIGDIFAWVRRMLVGSRKIPPMIRLAEYQQKGGLIDRISVKDEILGSKMQFSEATDRFVVSHIVRVTIRYFVNLSYVWQVLSEIKVAHRLDVLAHDKEMVRLSICGTFSKH
jgi:hypothetical protein